MTGDLGEVVKPYLKAGYSAVYYDPRAAGFEGLDDLATVDAADVDTITSEEPDMSDNLTPEDAARIKAEAERILASEEIADMHNWILHERIVTAWQMYHEEMWRELQRLGIGKEFAVVQQNRMWRENDLLEAGGMPPNEAQKIAEREHLMLAPDG
ncbi:hypothetical protein [Halomonas sp. RT37]|uniref:Uncharacterized protein n=1 Tax=Halomonas sp. RT37 TaxID=2950872 RepID=A0AAU7KIE1_9GAMM